MSADYSGWTPTSANINALPDPIRKYIHDLETNCDPAGMVAENICLREQRDALGIADAERESLSIPQEWKLVAAKMCAVYGGSWKNSGRLDFLNFAQSVRDFQNGERP